MKAFTLPFRHSQEISESQQCLFLSAFGRRAALTVRPFAMLAHIVPRGPESISQHPFNTPQVLAEPGQNKFALFAARHFVSKQPEDQWIGGLANSSDRYLGSLGFQATQASTIHKRFRVITYWRTTKLGNTLASQTQ